MADDVVLSKVANIEGSLARIREEYGDHEDHVEADLRRQDSIVLNLQRACQSAIDLAHHLVRRQRLGLPQDSRDPFQMLERAGWLTEDLSHRLQAMVGFRNIAVHRYRDLDLAILRSILDERLDDFVEFTSCVLRRGEDDA